jgi:hypothetical protein
VYQYKFGGEEEGEREREGKFLKENETNQFNQFFEVFFQNCAKFIGAKLRGTHMCSSSFLAIMSRSVPPP